jgi:hypothetical protein
VPMNPRREIAWTFACTEAESTKHMDVLLSERPAGPRGPLMECRDRTPPNYFQVQKSSRMK